MKKLKFIASAVIAIAALTSANCAHAQFSGVKVNALTLAVGTINAGFEFSTGNLYSYEISIYWKPFTTDKLPRKVFCVQPSVRYWLKEHYTGHFFAAHPAFGILSEKDNIYCNNGWLAGIGLSYGYCRVLARRWNLSTEIGPGIYYLKERKSNIHVDPTSDEIITHRHRIMLLPSKLEVSVIYIF